MNRRKFLKAIGYRVAVYGLLPLSVYQYGRRVEAEWLQIERVNIFLPRLHADLSGFRIVQMSDFHFYPYVRLEYIREAVLLANTLHPDLIVLTGDYIDHQPEAIRKLAPLLSQLDAKLGVFAVLGNHDIWGGKKMIASALRQAGLTVLVNDGVLLGTGQAALYLAGLDDGFSGHPDLSKALAKLPEGVPCILLVHEPDLADEFAGSGRVSIQLSGHTHGGQVRLPGIGAPVLPPLGEKYDAGLYRVKDMQLYTTRGIGVIGLPYGPPIRLNCRPEITELTLRN
ncbi:MAG: metallophosphoesterase [Gammaproteobacteria bacterium]|nr:metallophosphoesterase [Gammaproteobacteria bacterium]